MKISGKFILKVAGTLTVISLVVAALLGLVDNVTADKIAAIDAENTRIAMSAVSPASGSQGTIGMMVGVDANKAVTGVSVVSHSETSGIGTKVVGNEPNAAGVPVLDQFIGMSGAGSLVVGKNITAVSGATVSTKGINTGVNAALAAVEALG